MQKRTRQNISQDHRMALYVFVIVIILAFAFASCNNGSGNRVVMSRDEYNKLKGIQPQDKLIINDNELPIRTASDGHDYICYFGGYATVITHWPECKLCKTRVHNTP